MARTTHCTIPVGYCSTSPRSLCSQLSEHTPYGYDQNNMKDVGLQAQSIATILKIWRRSLPHNLAWDDEDFPSTDINVARLRAKYYGGLYMVLRPFLRIAVLNWGAPSNLSHAGSPANASAVSTNPIRTTSYTGSIDDVTLLELVHECIESAIRSTIAFDRVGASPNSDYRGYISERCGRLILTNIFGTLHA
jgi:hypothetical protein